MTGLEVTYSVTGHKAEGPVADNIPNDRDQDFTRSVL